MSDDSSRVNLGLKTDLMTDVTGLRTVRISLGDQAIHLDLKAARKLGEVMLAWGSMAERASLSECQSCQGTGLRVIAGPREGNPISSPCLCLRGEVWRMIGATSTPEQMTGLLRWLQLR